MSAKTIRVAMIGLGGVCAQVHYPGFSRIPGVDIVGICDPDASLREIRCREWRVEASFGDVDELLLEIKPDAVVIATPNCTHKSLILKAFASGSHVLCEKPLGMNLQETKEILEVAQKTQLRHMTAFTYRFVPAMNYIRHLVRTGALGEIRHERFHRLQDWGERAIGWRQYYLLAGSGELRHGHSPN